MKFIFFFFLSSFLLTSCSSFKNFFKVSGYEALEFQEIEFQTLWVQNINSIDKYHIIVGSSYLSFSPQKETFVVSNGSNKLLAFEVKTGRKVWEFAISGGVEGEPVISEKRVFLGGRDGVFYVISLDTGEKIWSYKTKSTSVSSPWVTKKRVYFQTSLGEVYSLDKKTGKKVWERSERIENNLSVKGIGRPFFYKGKLLVGFQNGIINAYRAVDGILLWSQSLKSENQSLPLLDVDATPVVFRSKVFVSNFDSYLYCLNISTGRVLWKKPYGSAFSVTLDSQKGLIYHSTSRGEVVALNLSGDLIWSYKTKGIALAPVIGKKHLWVGEFQGALKALSLKDGKLKAFMNPGEGLVSPPVILDSKKIFFLSKRGNVFNLKF